MIDQQLLSCLFASISEKILPLILNFQHSKDAWDALERKFSSVSRSHILQLKSRIQNIKKGDDSISDYLQKVKSISDTLATVNSPLKDEDLLLHILNGLPITFHPFKTTIRTRSHPVSVAKLHDLLLIEDKLLTELLVGDNLPLLPNLDASAFAANQQTPEANYNRGN